MLLRFVRLVCYRLTLGRGLGFARFALSLELLGLLLLTCFFLLSLLESKVSLRQIAPGVGYVPVRWLLVAKVPKRSRSSFPVDNSASEFVAPFNRFRFGGESHLVAERAKSRMTPQEHVHSPSS